MESGAYGLPNMNVTSRMANRENVKNVFLTLPGQRLVNNQVGSYMRKIVFETGHQSEIKEKLKAEARRVYSVHFPTLSLVSVIVESQEDSSTIPGGEFRIHITHAPQNIRSQTDMITFTLSGRGGSASKSALDDEYVDNRRKERADFNL